MEHNPNETILIPLLNKRVTDLTTANILLEAKVAWAEQEKDALAEEVKKKTEEIEGISAMHTDHAAALATAVEEAKQAVRGEWEAEKTELLKSFEDQKKDLSASITFAVNDVKRAANMDIGYANSQRDEIAAQYSALQQRMNELEGIRAQFENMKIQYASILAENAQLKRTVEELKPLPQPPVQEAQVIGGKKRSKKKAVVLGGDTY